VVASPDAGEERRGMAVVDIQDPDLYVDRVPHDRFRQLRLEEPVSWHDEPDGSGFWAIVRHPDVVEAGRDWRSFSSAQGSTLEELDAEQLAVRRSMLDMDPPDHTRLRRLVGPGFSPKVVRGYEVAIRLLIREVLDQAITRGTFDLVEEVSKPIPAIWLCKHLGVPEADAGLLIDLTDRMLGQSDPEYQEHPTAPEEVRFAPFGTLAGLESYDYAAALADERRSRPTDDILSQILFAEPGGEPLTRKEFQNFFSVLMIAGQEASRHSISHGTLALIEHPESAERLHEFPSLMGTATEEIIRWSTPIYHFRRTATADIEMHSKRIRAGDKVTLWYISANFDETVIPNPLQFDILREPNDHVAFGKGGPHFCLGAGLARLQVRIAFEELLPRISSLRLAGEPERLRSNFIHGMKHLPIEVIPA
jgi:cytochrome P450